METPMELGETKLPKVAETFSLDSKVKENAVETSNKEIKLMETGNKEIKDKTELKGDGVLKVTSEGEKERKKEHKHKHKHKHKHHDDKEKHKSSHHDKSEKHKSHHHDKEKDKSHHKPHKSKFPDPIRVKSSIFGPPMDATDVNRLLSEPIDREIDGGSNFQISKPKKIKDDFGDTPKKRKRSRMSDGVAIPGMHVEVEKKYLKPFDEGWKREIVLRNPANEQVIGAGTGRPKADVYYYAPAGKKLRSMKEIENFLEENPSKIGNVTIDNFIWVKGAIFQEPEETVRTAADRGGRASFGSPMGQKIKGDNWQAKKKLKAATLSPSGPIMDSPGQKHRHKSFGTLSVKFPFSSKSGPPVKQVAKKGTGGSKSISTGVAKKSTARKHTASVSSELKRPTQRLCGLKCPGLEGTPPSLQCGICMCLFHPSCVGQSGTVPGMYICPACTTPPKPKDASNGTEGAMMNGTGPKVPSSTLAVPSNLPGSAPISGQLLTLPSSVLSKVNAQQPLQLRVNNQKLVIPPNCFIPTPDGVKVFLPAGTLPPTVVNSENKAANVQLSVNKDQGEQSVSVLCGPNGKGNGSAGANIVPECLLPKDDTCYFEKLQVGVDIILNILRFLPHSDLLRATQTCQMWKKVAENQSLWKTVRLRRIRVSQWEEAAKAFKKHGTKTLDLRGMLFYEDKNRTWHQLTSVLHQMTDIRQIYLSQSPAHMLHTIADRLSDLEGLVAEQVFDADQTYKPTIMQTTKLDIGKFCNLKRLYELKVRSPNGLSLPPFSFSGGLQGLSELTSLKILSVTSLREVPSEKFGFLSALPNLEDLELGDCLTFTEQTYGCIGKLTNLKRLRLECGGQDTDEPLTNALKNLVSLECLELIRYQIGKSLKDCLKGLENLRKMSVWPDGGNQAATINTNTLNAVIDLTKLVSLDWGIMIDDGSSIILDDDTDGSDPAEKSFDSEKKTECIPFLPQNNDKGETEGSSGDVELMPEYTSTSQLVEKLCNFLPDTKIRVFRIPVLSAVVNSFTQ